MIYRGNHGLFSILISNLAAASLCIILFNDINDNIVEYRNYKLSKIFSIIIIDKLFLVISIFPLIVFTAEKMEIYKRIPVLEYVLCCSNVAALVITVGIAAEKSRI
jgi:hypothetical protein